MDSGLKGFAGRPYKDFQLGLYPAVGAAITVNHGLGRFPSKIVIMLECLVAQASWLPGDRILMSGGVYGLGANLSCGNISMTQNFFSYVVSATAMSMNDRSTGAAVGLTPTSWKIIARVFA